MTGIPDIVVTNSTDGQTTLRAVEGNEVRVRITTDGWDRDDVDVHVRQDGNQIRIETRREEWRWFNWRRSPRVHIEIEAPPRSDIDARNDDGTLSVTGFEGRLSLSVDDGRLRVTDVSGELTARGDDGHLDLRRVTGSVDVRMDDGDLASPSPTATCASPPPHGFSVGDRRDDRHRLGLFPRLNLGAKPSTLTVDPTHFRWEPPVSEGAVVRRRLHP